MSFEMPKADQKAAYVQALFDSIADRYDRVNDLMTGGMHRKWKRDVLHLARVSAGSSVLDLCTGTGDLAFGLAERVGAQGRVVGLDFSEGMLAQARRRPSRGLPIDWQQGDATTLPFADESFDAVTVGFGLRNVSNLDAALAEAYRVLKPGGRMVSLDLGKPRLGLLRNLIDLYSFRVVPLIGGLSSGHRAAYEYLPSSNLSFPSQDELAERMRGAGFSEARVHDRALGAVAIVWGQK